MALRRHTLSAVTATAVLLLVLFATQRSQVQADAPEAPQLVRIYYDAISDLAQLSAYDLLEVNNLAEGYVIALARAADVQHLRRAGWRVEPDYAANARLRLGRADLFAEGYHTVQELYTRIDQLAAAHPALAAKVIYGQSYCKAAGGCSFPGGETLAGFELTAVRLTNEAVPGTSQLDGQVQRGTKPVFFLMANIHAREISTPELALRWIEHLLDNHGVDPDITWLLDHHELWVVPIVNPDGHWIVEMGTMDDFDSGLWLHRKNANQDTDGDGLPDCGDWPSSSWSQFGVDLNRNHSFSWLPSNLVTDQCGLLYPGPGAASEPEVAQLEGLIRALIADQRGPLDTDEAPLDTRGLLISLHSYSNLVLRPWSHVNTPAPNEVGLKAIGDKFARFNGYESCQPGLCLYNAAATSDNWAYGELGIPAFTFEIGNTFTPPYEAIANDQFPRNLPAFLFAAQIAGEPYALVQGPEATAVTVQPDSPGDTLTLTAVLDDSDHGRQPIAAAGYTIGSPPWLSPAALQPMQAIDARFDSVQEQVTATISSLALPSARQLVYVQGRDSDGNWGAARAAFVQGTAVSWHYIPLAVAP